MLDTFEGFYPAALHRGEVERYVEPFVGSGAVLLHIMQHFPVKEACITDVNPDLVTAYATIKEDVENLIGFLARLEAQYLALDDKKRREFYLALRNEYNRMVAGGTAKDNGPQTPAAPVEHRGSGNPGGRVDTCANLERAGLFLFLNRTCYNGLYRVNRAGLFNVPPGRYKKPCICNAANLRAVNRVLQRVTVLQGDYRACSQYINEKCFVYFDPPYRPLSPTSGFTSYSKTGFGDGEQAALADFFRAMDQKGALLMLSNSNPQNTAAGDDFFHRLYRGFNFHTVKARRLINSRANGRGDISELVITNYTTAPTAR